MNVFFEALGYLAGICTAIVFLPQTIQTIKDKNVSGLSLGTYIIYCIGMISWQRQTGWCSATAQEQSFCMRKPCSITRPVLLIRRRSSVHLSPKRFALSAQSSSTKTARSSCIRWRRAMSPRHPSSANARHGMRAWIRRTARLCGWIRR